MRCATDQAGPEFRLRRAARAQVSGAANAGGPCRQGERGCFRITLAGGLTILASVSDMQHGAHPTDPSLSPVWLVGLRSAQR